MNAERRKELDRAIAMIEEARSIVEAVKDAEQEAFDNMPESFQNGERGEKSQACIDAMDNIDTSLDDALGSFDDAKGEA